MSLCNCNQQFCKNIPVSFDFITTWNQGVFLCSPCIIASCCWCLIYCTCMFHTLYTHNGQSIRVFHTLCTHNGHSIRVCSTHCIHTMATLYVYVPHTVYTQRSLYTCMFLTLYSQRPLYKCMFHTLYTHNGHPIQLKYSIIIIWLQNHFKIHQRN